MTSPHRSLVVLAPLCAAALCVVAAPSAAAQNPRVCVAADLEGVRNTPLVVEEATRDRAEAERLVAGRAYEAVVVRELAIGDDRQPADGSFAVTGLPGLDSHEVDGRPAWSFTAPERGPVELTVSWRTEAFGDPADVCQASETVALTVQQIGLAEVGEGRFLGGRKILGDAFRLPLGAPKLADPPPVSVLIRIRTGTTKAPAPRGAATVRATLRPNRSDAAGGFSGGRGLGPRWLRQLGMHTDVNEREAIVYPDGNIPFGTTLRFGFSIEVRQAGRRIGGYASGATCRRVQLPDFSLMRCRAVKPRQLRA